MSILSDFTASNYAISKGIIGASSFVIGTGDAIDVIPAETRHERESELNGFQKSTRLTLVCSVTDFRAAYPLAVETYLGKHCTNDLKEFRLADIEEGAGFVTINLTSRTEVS